MHVDIQPPHRAAGKVTGQKEKIHIFKKNNNNLSRVRSGPAWAKLHVQQELGEDIAEADLQEYLVLMVTFRLCHQPLEVRCRVRTSPSHPGQQIFTGHTWGEAGQGAALGCNSPAG